MPEWIPIVVTLLGSVLLFAGGAIGSVLTTRAAKQANVTAAQANVTAASVAERSAENDLIDQLQEELALYRLENNARATEQDKRLQKLEDRNLEITEERDILRDYAHQLRSDIFSEKKPPPTDWPAGVYR